MMAGIIVGRVAGRAGFPNGDNAATFFTRAGIGDSNHRHGMDNLVSA
jgi:hypothetical protein